MEFESIPVKQQTNAEFQLNRQWGVRGYPTVLFRIDQQLFQVCNGYTEFEPMKATIEKILALQVQQA